VVGKDELIAQAWPGVFVEEGNLRVHIAALRRAMGDGQGGRRFIVTLPGRGYSFVAPISVAQVPGQADVPALAPAPSAPADRLPALLTRIVGRGDVIETLTAQLPRHRFVTVVGPGGIGKTTVALAAADVLRLSYRDGVQFVDLAPITNAALVSSALASVLGLPVGTDSPIPALVAAMRERDMLLVLDSCEHVIDAAARLCEAIFAGAPRVHILATSREAFRVAGERVLRLSPLDTPPETPALSAKQALAFPAVQLFVERASAALDSFALLDDDAPVIAEICRRLDGIALAIELAAGRVDAFGVRGVAARLDDRFRLLRGGHRTALPRHQTLSATLDWSYQLLPEPERVVLRRIAVLGGNFTFDSAAAVATGDGIRLADVFDHVASLVSASLIAVDAAGDTVHYRLLESTRAYARDRLIESGEYDRTARRHAEYFRDLFMRAEAELATRAGMEWNAVYGRQLDNARAALEWAYSLDGDLALGVTLTVFVAPLWTYLSLNEECRSGVERALTILGADPDHDRRREMQLLAALGNTLLYTKGAGTQARAAWLKTLEIAEAVHDKDYQLRALRGLWADTHNASDHRAALMYAEKFVRVAATSDDATDSLTGDRMMGMSFFFRGELKAARFHIARVLAGYPAATTMLHVIRFQFHPLMIARTNLAGILWLQGFPEQAMEMAERSIADARAIDHARSLTYALAHAACRIALNNGDLEAAGRYVMLLQRQAALDPVGPWDLLGRCWNGLLLIDQGDPVAGSQLLEDALVQFPKNSFHLRYTSFLGSLADAWSRAGETAKAQAAIAEALAICDHNDERWGYAELLRIKGEILVREGAPGAAAAAEGCFAQSLDWARRQDALAWELRTATSLARLRRDEGRIAEAHALLESVYRRFEEGFDTNDLKSARNLLDGLR
jgi:predicted ATPase